MITAVAATSMAAPSSTVQPSSNVGAHDSVLGDPLSRPERQKSFCNFIAAPMSPLIFSFPVM
jgi:hypothetical protein